MNIPTVYQAWGIIFDLIGSNDNSIEANDKAAIYISYNNGAVWFGCPTGGLNDNQWHHVVVTYSTSSNKLAVYLDGREDINRTYNYSTPITTVRIGGPRQFSAVWRRLLGRLDEVSVYNRALNTVEVKSLFWYGPEWTLFATNPNPADGAVVTSTNINLGWVSGKTAAKHHVYFGENTDDVKTGTGGTDKGLSNQNNFLPQNLVVGKTYYWRVDEVEADGVTAHTGVVWRFIISPKMASNPVPSNGAVLVDPNITLSWSAGSGAVKHDVFFGTVSPPPLVSTQQTATIYDPTSPLNYHTTHYWRIVESDGTGTYPGDIWSFKTTPEIPFTEDPNLIGWYKFDADESNVAIDWSGYSNHGSVYGEPDYVPGNEGSAMAFDGNDDLVEVSITTSNDFTLMAWIKTDTPGPEGTTGRDGSGLIWSDYAGGGDHFILAVLGTKLAFQSGPSAVSSKRVS
jgi:hypothetical protein